MLLQLQPEQVAKYWDIVKYAIESAFPPTVKERPDMNRVFEALLAGDMIAWVSVDDESRKISAIVSTTIQTDTCTGTKNLLLYSVFSLTERIGRKNWKDGYDTLMKFARAKGCSHMVGYTKVDAVKQLASYFGGDIDWTFISINI